MQDIDSGGAFPGILLSLGSSENSHIVSFGELGPSTIKAVETAVLKQAIGGLSSRGWLAPPPRRTDGAQTF